MHGIIKPIDIVLSTRGSEWHGLADEVPTIDDATIAPLLFPIITGDIVIDVEGKSVKMGHHKALVADLRICRPDLWVPSHECTCQAATDEDCTCGATTLIPGEDSLTPLHIPKNSYKEITNGEVWAALKKALEGMDIVVSSAGTLHAGKKFFLSADLAGASEMEINGDKFHSYLNFVTSHDGTLAFTASDSHVRQVCMNTVKAALSSKGDLDFRVYHSAGAEVAIANLGALLNAVIAGRAEFKTNLEYFASLPISGSDVENLFAGYFAQVNGVEELAKRSLNAVDSLATLFHRGIECKGQTVYDAWNAFTQYFTHEDGTGKKASKLEKAYKANFGGAADHKEVFTNYLLSDDKRAEFIAAGAKVLSIARAV